MSLRFSSIDKIVVGMQVRVEAFDATVVNLVCQDTVDDNNNYILPASPFGATKIVSEAFDATVASVSGSSVGVIRNGTQDLYVLPFRQISRVVPFTVGSAYLDVDSVIFSFTGNDESSAWKSLRTGVERSYGFPRRPLRPVTIGNEITE